MRKLIVVVMVLLLAAALLAGCAKEESTKKLASRPVTARESGVPPAAETDYDSEESVPQQTPIEEEKPVQRPKTSSSGSAQCEQLTIADLGTVMGGTWTKTSDCPTHPAMPGGVSVCQCSYDGPKQVYVNVEVQKYTSADEAERVFNMYCDPDSESAGVGTDSCIREKSSASAPAYVYVAAPSYFIKLSCLGGTCPFSQLTELAGMVEANI